MLEEGIELVFAPYVLASFSAGMIEVEIDYNYEEGRLGDKYYPDLDTLLDEAAGTWVKVVAYVDDDTIFTDSALSETTLTLTRDGLMSYHGENVWDGEIQIEETYTDIPVTLKEGRFYMETPNHMLNYMICETNDPEGSVPFEFALDDNRLLVLENYEQEGDEWSVGYAYCVYYREDDPERYQLGGSWIGLSMDIPGLDITYLSPSADNAGAGDLYMYLYFSKDYSHPLSDVPERNWQQKSFAVGEEENFTIYPDDIEVIRERMAEDMPATWYTTFSRNDKDGSSSAYNIGLLDRDLLRVEEYYRMAENAMPMVITYTFYREGTAAGYLTAGFASGEDNP